MAIGAGVHYIVAVVTAEGDATASYCDAKDEA